MSIDRTSFFLCIFPSDLLGWGAFKIGPNPSSRGVISNLRVFFYTRKK